MNNEKEQITVKIDEKPFVKTTKVKKKGNGKFNVVDFFLILIIAVAVAASVIYFVPGIAERFSAGNQQEITVVLEFKGVDSEFASDIKSGEAVYDGGEHYKLGTVKSAENYAYTVPVYNEENPGMAELHEIPELKNVIVTVTVSAKYTAEEGYSVNGKRIAVGCEYDISFPNFGGSAYCIGVSAVSE